MDFPFGENILYRQRLPQIPGGGTVSVPAMFSAYIAGAREILFFGQDLAFKDGRKYAKDSGGTMTGSDLNIVNVPGIDGSMVETSTGFQACIQQIGMMVSQFKKREVMCYNMDSKGARIAGLKNERFAEWIKTRRYPQIKDVSAVVDLECANSASQNLKDCVRDMIINMQKLMEDLFISPVTSLEKIKNENPMAWCFEKGAWMAMLEGKHLERYKAFGCQVMDNLYLLASRIDH